jgi:hypothetical protein
MGFHLKHLLCICTLLLLSTVACQPKKVGNQLGPEAPLADVQKAVTSPVDGFTALDLKKGDQVLNNSQLYVATAPMRVTASEKTEIFDNSEDTDNVYFSMIETSQNYDENGDISQWVVKHHEFGFTKKSAAEPEEKTIPDPSISFHNLHSVQAQVPPPALVQQRKNCQGIPKCLINVTIVDVDKVMSQSTKFQTIHMTWVLSKEVPYLADVLSQCSSMVTEIQATPSTKVPAYVKFCTDVIDFVYGQPPTPASKTAGSASVAPPNSIDSVNDWSDFDPVARLGGWIGLRNASDYLPAEIRPN